MNLRFAVFIVVTALPMASVLAQTPGEPNLKPGPVQATLIAPGSPAFHLKATITDNDDPSAKTQVEMFWAAPDKWRRTIQSDEFSQTLIVNGSKTFEEDSDDYFPLALQTLVTAMVDPRPLVEALRPGDSLQTKANGASKESGEVCFGKPPSLCTFSSHGLREIVDAPGHHVQFMDYRAFKDKRVARLLVTSPENGVSLTARVSELTELTHPDEGLFSVPKPTLQEDQIRPTFVSEAELRGSGIHVPEIIWPQALDGATKGTASIYVSIDPSGEVRETVPVHTDNERTNDSVRRQIMKWKFKPVLRDGTPVQAESILTFALDTRAWGPPAPLNDAEVRKLASNRVEPVIPPGIAPAGTTYTLHAAIDSEGQLIEVIAGSGPPKLFTPCYQAISHWKFSPILEAGQPRPYRAEIVFQVP